MLVNPTLPTPDPTSQQHMQKMLQYLQSLITQREPITFADYMKAALYAPGLGYYSAGRIKFGKEGDFVTAPEISPLFGQCLALQCLDILSKQPQKIILEFGAGSGKLAQQILESLQQQEALPDQYYILEVSADLRERQQTYLQQQLPHYVDKITWLNQLPSEPFDGVIIANEVLDAMPVELFKYSHDQGILQGYVTLQANVLQPVWQPASPELKKAVEELNVQFTDGYTSEINLNISPWIKSLNTILNSGAIFLIDYGFPAHEYYHIDRSMGTLMCHFHHHNHTNPYLLPGIQDITAHVDFTAVAQAADVNHLQIAGFTHQAGFLLNCGITHLLNTSHSLVDKYRLNQQVMLLTSPSEMGELFKVIGLTKGIETELRGFQQFNQLNRL